MSVLQLATYSPPVGATFSVLDGSSRTGTFSKLTLDVVSGTKYYGPIYTSTGVYLLVDKAAVSVSPSSGPAGTTATVSGTGFPRNVSVLVSFMDAAKKTTSLGSVPTDASGAFSVTETVPAGAATGNGKFIGNSKLVKVSANAKFVVG